MAQRHPVNPFDSTYAPALYDPLCQLCVSGVGAFILNDTLGGFHAGDVFGIRHDTQSVPDLSTMSIKILKEGSYGGAKRNRVRSVAVRDRNGIMSVPARLQDEALRGIFSPASRIGRVPRTGPPIPEKKD